jgi:hypothetical protein
MAGTVSRAWRTEPSLAESIRGIPRINPCPGVHLEASAIVLPFANMVEYGPFEPSID